MGYFVKRHLRLRKEGDKWFTDEVLQFVTEEGILIEVPVNFQTDGASIPRFLWRVIGHPFAEYLRAAVLHDYLYSKKIIPRKRCDELFLEAMKSDKVGPVKRRLLYWAVWMFGWTRY